jgi:transposase-like protein
MTEEGESAFKEFQEQYKDDDVCQKYLFQKRWPGGFHCPHCGHTEYYFHKNRHLYACKECGYQASVMAGTVMHRSHTPLRKWFWAIFLAINNKKGISAHLLAIKLGVSHTTAWLMLQKIRKAFANRNVVYRLGGTVESGIVELDNTFFVGMKRDGKRRGGTEKTSLIVAVSLNDSDESEDIKMVVNDDLTSKNLDEFPKKNIMDGATIRYNVNGRYKAFPKETYHLKPLTNNSTEGKQLLQRLQTVVSDAKTFILETYRVLDATYFQTYLDEYCFRRSWKFFTSHLFDQLLSACCPTTIVTHKNPVNLVALEMT